jgi:hypothetical protein
MSQTPETPKDPAISLEEAEINRFMYAAELARSDGKYLDALMNLERAEGLSNLSRTQQELARRTQDEIKQERARIAKEAEMERQRQEQLKAQEAKQKKEAAEAEKKQRESPVIRGVKTGAKMVLGATAAIAIAPLAIPVAARYLRKKAPTLRRRLARAGMLAAAAVITPAVMRKLRTAPRRRVALRQGLAKMRSLGNQASVAMGRIFKSTLGALGIP